MNALSRSKCLDVAVLTTASLFLVAHVFVLNDWSGSSTDLRDPNRRTTQAFSAGGRSAAAVCVALLAVSLLLLAPFGWTPVLLASTLAILSGLYSAPMFAMKGVPLASSALHLLGGLLHFLLGYSVFRPPDLRGLAIGSFFALTFAAGHLTHEARDRGSDLHNGIQTNAVRFGSARSLAAGFLLFTTADVLLFVLAMRGLVPGGLMVIAGLYPIHVWWTLRTLTAGLTFGSIRRLQLRYRALYAILGFIMLVACCHDIL
jgi:4-hydroxybenzoate polyprenyltransferase